MIISRKYRPAMRMLAILLVTFQVAAVSRGVLPSICLTQRDAAQAAKAECTIGSMHACCMDLVKQSPSETPIAPRGTDNPGCAFCYLAKAYTEPALAFEHPFWQEQVTTPYDRGPGLYHGRPCDQTAQGRAPPAIKA